MKKIFLNVVFISITQFAISQPIPGNVTLKGSSAISGQFFTNNYSYSSNNSSQQIKTSEINFQPAIGVFVSFFVNIGAYIDINSIKEVEDNNFNKTKTLTIGPYIRVYFSDTKLAPFIQVNAGYSNYKIFQNNNSEFTMDGANYRIAAGLERFFNKKCSFEVLLGYSGNYLMTTSSNLLDITKIKSKGIELSIGANLFLK
jgi:hypothetical protein